MSFAGRPHHVGKIVFNRVNVNQFNFEKFEIPSVGFGVQSLEYKVLFVCFCFCIWACKDVCLFVCVYVCRYLWIWVRVWANTLEHVHINMIISTFVDITEKNAAKFPVLLRCSLHRYLISYCYAIIKQSSVSLNVSHIILRNHVIMICVRV